MLRASATISPNFLLKKNVTEITLHGFLEYYLQEQISVRGDGVWYVDEQQNAKVFKQNSKIYFGAMYHLNYKRLSRFDAYVGIQPGIAATQPLSNDSLNRSLKVVSLFSVVGGANYYVGKYFNFFAETRYSTGKYYGVNDINLSGISFSAGLGFNIKTNFNKN